MGDATILVTATLWPSPRPKKIKKPTAAIYRLRKASTIRSAAHTQPLRVDAIIFNMRRVSSNDK
jgi:hypothetical protein